MNDKQYNQLRNKILKLLDKWVKPMGLGWYSILYVWKRDKPDDGVGATTDYSLWMYKKITISFNMPILLEVTDKELESTVTHELCHILVAPLANNMRLADTEDEKYRTDLIEQVTESLNDTLRWVRQAGSKDKL